MGKQRQRTRIKSRVDELPEEMRKILDIRLADVNYTYQEIADELNQKGYEISKSAVGRYALRQGSVLSRLKEATEQTRLIVEAIKDDTNNMDAIGAVNKLMAAELAKKIATAQEEIAEMPIDKAGRLAVAIERATVYKEKFRLEYNKGIKDAVREIKKELQKELRDKSPELYSKLCSLADEVESRMEGGTDG